MNERGKSDGGVVPAKPANNTATAVAELVEERRPAKGNMASKTRPGHRAGSGALSALDRVREVARKMIEDRMVEVGLRLHPDKTRIVYCQDANRRGSAEHTSFTFPGYTFRERGARNNNGVVFTSFLPAVSKDALKKMGQVVRQWRIHRRTDLNFADLARMINPIVRGWMNYYGAFYPSALSTLLARINTYLVRWVRKKYKRLRSIRKAQARWEYVTTTYPRYLAHWEWVTHPLMIKTARAV